VAGKVSPYLEKLLTKDSYHVTNDGSFVYLATAEKILNRLLGRRFPPGGRGLSGDGFPQHENGLADSVL
jgi:hypothetical protein